MSSGVLAISLADNPKPIKNKQLAITEQAQGPYLSMILPMIAANGYWPIIPLRRQSAIIVFYRRTLTPKLWSLFEVASTSSEQSKQVR